MTANVRSESFNQECKIKEPKEKKRKSGVNKFILKKIKKVSSRAQLTGFATSSY